MSKTMRVVVPPHPLIGHWLTLLRDHETPPALFSTALSELGRWLTYEALRDWIPYQRVQVQTPLAATEATVVDGSVPMLAAPLLPAGLGLWDGARAVVPSAALAPLAFQPSPGAGDRLCTLNGLPASIPARAGVLVFTPLVATGASLIRALELLDALGVNGLRVRVITALVASPGLKQLGERFPELTLYSGCIDAELDAQGRILPGLGDADQRFTGLGAAAFVG